MLKEKSGVLQKPEGFFQVEMLKSATEITRRQTDEQEEKRLYVKKTNSDQTSN